MEFRVTAVGASLEQVTREATRDLRTANRTVGRKVAKVGVAAIRKGAPRMWGKPLSAKSKVDAWPDRAAIEFQASPAGAWAIAQSGTRPHAIEPRSRKALRFAGRFAAAVNHPGTGGSKAWTKAGARLAKAIEPAITDVYGAALGA